MNSIPWNNDAADTPLLDIEIVRQKDADKVYPLFQIPNWYAKYLKASETQKVLVNDQCPCGSGFKFKKCCMRRVNREQVTRAVSVASQYLT